MGEIYINKGGKPKKFQDLKALEAAIEDYFKKKDKAHKPYTITGLAITLGTSRRTLLNIQKEDYYSNDFKHLINTAKERILERVEEGLLSGTYNAAGSIFTLKNNGGWVDKTEQTIEVKNSIADTLETRRKRVIEAAKVIEIEHQPSNEKTA